MFSKASFDKRKASWQPVEDCCDCFDYCNSCSKPVEVQQIIFDHRITCIYIYICIHMHMNIDVLQACFDYRKSRWMTVQVLPERFDCQEVCWRPVEAGRSSFNYTKSSWRPVVARRASVDYHKTCSSPLDVPQAHFDDRQGSWKTVEECHAYTEACWMSVEDRHT